MKVKISNRKLREKFFLKISLFSAFATLLLAFVPIPSDIQGVLGVIFLVFLVILYIYDWNKANKLNSIEIDIEGYQKDDGSESSSINPDLSDSALIEVGIMIAKQFSIANEDYNKAQVLTQAQQIKK